MAKKRKRNQHLSREALAARLEVSPRTIDRWAQSGEIEPVPQRLPPGRGRRVVYDWHDVCEQLGIEP